MNRKQRRAEKKQAKPVVQRASPGVQEALADAFRHHQAGRLNEAERLYRHILAVDPQHADSLHLLGVVAHQVGRHDLAVELISKAIAINAKAAEYHSNLGLSLRAQGKLDEAVTCYRQALVLKPDYAEAHNNLGNALKDQGKLDEAVPCYRQALVLKPDYAEAHNNLGAALKDQNKLDEAVTSYRQALVLRPDYAEANNNLGDALHDQGKLDEAIAAYRQVLVFGPDHAEAYYNLGNVLRDQDKPDAAVAAYHQALVLKPDYAEAHNNLGNALQDQGKMDEAVACYRQALVLRSDFAEVHSNLGNALLHQGKLDEAIAAYRQALVLKPNYAEAHYNLGNALRDQGKRDEAEASYRWALVLEPDYAEAHNNLGNALRDQGKLDEAVACFRKALVLRSDYAEVHSNLGNALKDQGKLDEAVACYRQALVLKPDYTDALNNLALVLIVQGKNIMALNVIKKSLQIKEAANTKKIFVNCVKRLRWTNDDGEIGSAVVRALTEPWSRPSDLAQVGADLVKLNPEIGKCVARAANAWPRRLSAQDLFGSGGVTALASNELLCALLVSTLISDIEIERFLTMSRLLMLEAATGAAALDDEVGKSLSFYSALARQCFINEYVFCHTDDEIQKASELRDLLVASLEAKTQVPVLWVLTVAAYFPLCSLPLAVRLLDTQWPDAVTAVLVQQVREPEEEHQLRTTIPRLTNIEDDVSRLVQHQYEQNPYPRWVKAGPVEKSITIVEYLCRAFPLASFQRHGKTGVIDFLIAGCGTGQHSIETTQNFTGARALAVDLSLSSLSYAKRKTRELGLTSIEYAQADLLELGSLGRSFDVIESVGVLHHLADPLAGWRVLLSLLRSGGFMKLGFYSEVARRNIVRARAIIAERGYGAITNDIRRFRQELIDLDKNANFEIIVNSPDFFSVSTCRDLLFHAQEHRMALPGIDAFLRDNGLTFLGFDIDADVLHTYKQRFPNDPAAVNLSQWQTFENENPDTFFGMYQFWIQKAG